MPGGFLRINRREGDAIDRAFSGLGRGLGQLVPGLGRSRDAAIGQQFFIVIESEAIAADRHTVDLAAVRSPPLWGPDRYHSRAQS